MSLGGRPCAQGKKREIVPAVPMGWNTRLANYRRQNGCEQLTPRQLRRLTKKSEAHERRRRGGAR